MMRHTVVSGIMETGSHTGRILNEISPTRHEYTKLYLLLYTIHPTLHAFGDYA